MPIKYIFICADKEINSQNRYLPPCLTKILVIKAGEAQQTQ